MMGELVAGTTFRWTAAPATITSTLQELDPPGLIAWTGKTSGIKAVHVHRLDNRDGTTVVTSEESWNGWLPRLMRGSMRKRLQGSIEAGLRHLKAEAERRAAQTSSS
jgi:hypothetical protein